MARYLDPMADLTFKRIFGEHPHLLKNFLNSVMPFETDRYIIELEYLPHELVPDNPGKKLSIVDVRCKDNYGRQFIVEIQTNWYQAFMNRIVFNAGKAFVRQLDSGENYHLLQPVYTLAILNENFDHKTDKFYHYYQIVNRENTDEIIPGLEFILVELTEKFHPDTIRDRKLMVLWLRFLKEVNEKMDTLPAEMQENEYIRQAAELCKEGAFTPAELARYDGFWDAVRIEKTIHAEGLEKGEVIGLEKGEAIGLKKGEAIGLEKGEAIGRAAERAEIQENVVINSHQAGLPVETISSITGLTPEQVMEILKRHGLI